MTTCQLSTNGFEVRQAADGQATEDAFTASDIELTGSRRPSRHDFTAHHPEKVLGIRDEAGRRSESHFQPNRDTEGVLADPERPYIPKLKYGWEHRREHRRSSSLPPEKLPLVKQPGDRIDPRKT